jgi:hypothetical protein
MSNFRALYARFFTRAAKVMAAFWILAGVAMAAISLTMKQNGWLMATCAGLFVVGVGVAIFFAKPVTGEKLQRIARGERLWGP